MSTYPTETQPRLLRRCLHRRMVAGVAAGLADYLEVDAATVRIAFAVLGLVGGIGIPLYLAAWLLLPEEGTELSIGEELAERFGVR